MVKKPAIKADAADIKAAALARTDGWLNTLIGLGTTSRDKRKANDFCTDSEATNRQRQEQLWEGDDMAARIVETVPNEMLRNGFEIKIQDEAQDTSTTEPDQKYTPGQDVPKVETPVKADAFPVAAAGPPPPPEKPPGVIEPKGEDSQKTADAVMARYEELRGDETLLLAGCYENAYGGAAILLGVDDGKDPKTPLDLKKIKTFAWMNVLTPQELTAIKWYGDPRAPKYGEPEIYRIESSSELTVNVSSTPNKKTSVALAEIHESRLIIFPGISVSVRHRLQRRGWGNSIFVRIWQVLSDHGMAYAGAAHLLTDFAQAVMKIKGLAEMVMQNADDRIIARAQLIDMTRSLARTVIIDADEEFERKQTPLSGLPEMIDRFDSRLAAAADMPKSLLMGQSPAGLNATGDADIRFFYDRVKSRQNKFLKPRLERLLKLIMLAKDGPTKGVEPENWCVEFNPLWQTTDKEQADVRFVQCQVDEKYITLGVLTPEEVTASRFGGASWSWETTVDIEGRKKLAAEHDQATADHAQATAEHAAKAEDQTAVENQIAFAKVKPTVP